MDRVVEMVDIADKSWFTMAAYSDCVLVLEYSTIVGQNYNQLDSTWKHDIDKHD